VEASEAHLHRPFFAPPCSAAGVPSVTVKPGMTSRFFFRARKIQLDLRIARKPDGLALSAFQQHLGPVSGSKREVDQWPLTTDILLRLGVSLDEITDGVDGAKDISRAWGDALKGVAAAGRSYGPVAIVPMVTLAEDVDAISPIRRGPGLNRYPFVNPFLHQFLTSPHRWHRGRSLSRR